MRAAIRDSPSLPPSDHSPLATLLEARHQPARSAAVLLIRLAELRRELRLLLGHREERNDHEDHGTHGEDEAVGGDQPKGQKGGRSHGVQGGPDPLVRTMGYQAMVLL